MNDAATLDTADPLASHRRKFLQSPDVIAYLDGNSLGRPLAASVDRVAEFMRDQWGSRLIRGWDEGWMTRGQAIGDDLGRVCIGAAPGQTTIGDSTTVLLYKLIRAAVDARPGRTEVVIDRGNFPTDRYTVEGVAAERGLTVRWIEAAPVTVADVAAVVGATTALLVLSHVDYRSAHMLDAPAITALAHRAGALVLWDLCHSVGAVPTWLDAWGVDLAVGCTYKYLNGGPGSPAFAYVSTAMQGIFRQPIQGWLGSRHPFTMAHGFEPAPGIRSVLSGTPPLIGMLAMQDMIALIEEAGMAAIRAKSVALTEFAIALTDELLPDATLASPRDCAVRGSHVTVNDDRFTSIMSTLWKQGIIPDFRTPNGIRLGLSPLSTSFAEVEMGVRAIAAALR
ncbi:kynureninase [Lacisediminihabitans sp.]|uniref:kynureninase n=1 Tax=Lacisediminihabitans sp. TaxID=2787631 RepID=UPI00374C8C62